MTEEERKYYIDRDAEFLSYVVIEGKIRPIDPHVRLDLIRAGRPPGGLEAVGEDQLNDMPRGPTINQHLMKDSKGNIYLMEDGKKRRFDGGDVFNKYGFGTNKIKNLYDDEMSRIKDGCLITGTGDPGPLPEAPSKGNSQNNNSSNKDMNDIHEGSWYMHEKDGQRKFYLDLDNKLREVDETSWKNMVNGNSPPTPLTHINNHHFFNNKVTGPLITIQCPLITGGGKVYLVDEGKKRWIINPDVFKKYGFSWSPIQHINERVEEFPTGPEIRG